MSSKGTTLVVGAPWAAAAGAAASAGAGDTVYSAGAACLTKLGVSQGFGIRAMSGKPKVAAQAKGKGNPKTKTKGKGKGKAAEEAGAGADASHAGAIEIERGCVRWGGMEWSSGGGAVPLVAGQLQQVILVGGSG